MRKYIWKCIARFDVVKRRIFDVRNARIISNSALFDKEWYLANNPDVKRAGVNPAVHFIRNGDLEKRNPGPLFDAQGYLLANPDVRQAGYNSLLHYLKFGRNERRLISPKMSTVKASASVPNLMHGLIRTRKPEYGPVARVLEFDHVAKIDPRLSMCVHLHLFHTDCAAEFLKYLKNIQVKFSLYVSVQSNEDVKLWKKFFTDQLPHLDKCIVKKCENTGRDVSPWVVLFKNEILKYDIFIHMHSKKSNYESKYHFWRKFLLHNTLGSKGIFSQIYNIFENDSSIGLVYPAYYGETRNQPSWGANKAAVNRLSRELLGVPELDICPDFPGGSFFWCRTSMLRPLLGAGLSFKDFDEEKGQIDGTLAHAIERFIGVLGAANGYKKICVTADVAYNLAGYWSRSRTSRITNSKDKDTQQVEIKLPPRDAKVGNLRVAVCSAVMGNFDELTNIPTVELGVDYFCFTDQPVSVPEPYKNRVTPYVDPNPRKTARFVKTHPHYFFPDYDVVVWIDANVVPLTGILPYVQILVESNSDIGVIRHPVRSGYIEEANECKRIGSDDIALLDQQASLYEQMGVKNEGLVETNILISRPSRKSVQCLFDTWWSEINTRSIRDQISLRYAIMKSGVKEIEIFEPGISTRDEGNFIHFAHDVKGRSRIVDFVMQTARD